MFSGGRFVNGDGDDVARIRNRPEAHERRHVKILRVLSIHKFFRGTGFARDAKPRYLALLRSTPLLGHGFEHLRHRPGGLGRNNLFADHVTIALEECNRQQHAVIGEDRVGARELKRADRYAVTESHVGLFDGLPGPGRAQSAGRLTRESGFWRDAEPQVVIHVPKPFGWKLQGNPGSADVA